jgi:hypothetical protein
MLAFDSYSIMKVKDFLELSLPIRVQSNGRKLGVKYKLRHLGFDFH